ncbi:hypothetical protein [Corynebacterium pseudotuberculosis]|uniref:hypothetical protein n=1 Tax=Corynebacterium pseudotuberculosis TaxID=1719 RepID=UPI001E3F66D1|nr:hypothetical protein [Corynebacterium pseudotuberculosis]
MSRSSRRLPFIISGILAAAIISPAAPAFAAPAAEDNILSELQALADAPTRPRSRSSRKPSSY